MSAAGSGIPRRGGSTLQSMTGFGRAVRVAPDGRTISVEARSHNHRHLDVLLRLPAEYGVVEGRLRAFVAERVRRGRVELSVAVEARAPASPVVDLRLAQAYHEALRELAERLGLPLGLDAAALAALPGVCPGPAAPPAAGAEEDWPVLSSAAGAALAELVAARAQEGAALREAIAGGLRVIEGCLSAAEARAPEVAAAREAAARHRLADLLGAEAGVAAGPAVAAILERLDVREELVRLRSHLGRARAALDEAAPGRRLDFLAQEMQREWSTLAAKAGDAAMAEVTVAARVAVEQVREQLANAE
jgi:uncharacterized protein (TIGR00255 family)